MYLFRYFLYQIFILSIGYNPLLSLCIMHLVAQIAPAMSTLRALSGWYLCPLNMPCPFLSTFLLSRSEKTPSAHVLFSLCDSQPWNQTLLRELLFFSWRMVSENQDLNAGVPTAITISLLLGPLSGQSLGDVYVSLIPSTLIGMVSRGKWTRPAASTLHREQEVGCNKRGAENE